MNCPGASIVQFLNASVAVPLAVTAIDAVTYDQGVVAGPPNQVGATATVNVWRVPTSWIGHTVGDPANGGTAWTPVGSGTLTVMPWPAASPITFATPLLLPAGSYGVAIEFEATTKGPNPGSLHMLGIMPNDIPTFGDGS